MTGLEDGARRYRATHGQPTPDEQQPPATETAVQRGRLEHRARRGDQPARQALSEWAATLTGDDE